MNIIKLNFVATLMLFIFSNKILAQNPMRHNRGLMVQKRLMETTDVPQLVKDTQQRMFPGTNVEKWFTVGEKKSSQNPDKNIEGKGNPMVYIAQFKNIDGFHTHCRITETGDVRGYMTRLEGEKGLPANIKEAIQKRFPEYKIQASQKIYYAKNNQSAYRISLNKNSTHIITFVDDNGNELKEDNMEPGLKENIIQVPEKE